MANKNMNNAPRMAGPGGSGGPRPSGMGPGGPGRGPGPGGGGGGRHAAMRGGEKPKDPFALGFVQAMTDY